MLPRNEAFNGLVSPPFSLRDGWDELSFISSSSRWWERCFPRGRRTWWSCLRAEAEDTRAQLTSETLDKARVLLAWRRWCCHKFRSDVSHTPALFHLGELTLLLSFFPGRSRLNKGFHVYSSPDRSTRTLLVRLKCQCFYPFVLKMTWRFLPPHPPASQRSSPTLCH